MGFLVAALWFTTQDSGIEWQRDVAAALQIAREYRKPAVLYFRAGTCKRSAALEAGAWKSDRIVAASKDFVTIWIDVDQDEARARAKYSVRFTPSVVFVDRDGASLGAYEGEWEAAPLAAKVEEMAVRYRGPWAPSIDAALARGRERKQPVVLVVWSDATEKATARITTVLGDSISRAVLFLRPFDDDAKKLVDGDRVWLVLDPLAEKPLDAPLAKIPVPKDAKTEDLVTGLRKARDAFEKAHPK